MPTIYLETHISAPIAKVFNLARSIDLHKLSATGTDEQAISGRTSGLICIGETVTWRAKHFGLYQKLTVQITEFEEPFVFVDVMIQGVFASMRHTHKFETFGSGTKMIDIFEYTSPLSIFGQFADFFFLKNYMKKFLITRNEILKNIAEAG